MADPARDAVRDVVAGADLGKGYAQIINLASTPDISASRYVVDQDEGNFTLEVAQVPYEAKLLSLTPDTDINWRLAGGYLQLAQDVLLDDLPASGQNIDSKWSAYSVTGGLVARINLGNGFTLLPALDFGVAQLDNKAQYGAAASALRPQLDGLLLNWQTKAWLITPSVGVQWQGADTVHRTRIGGHVARSWINSFDESDPQLRFRETANVYSVHAEYAAPLGMQLASRPLDWVVLGSYAGFFGADRDAMGLQAIAELGLALEVPLAGNDSASDRVRVGASYLFGPNGKGWTLGLGLQY